MKTDSHQKPKILVLCTGNSCRSHMAEGILKQIASDCFSVDSAGSAPAGYVHPLAIETMKEIGIDLSNHYSKSLDMFLDTQVNTVITVCDNANETCPSFGPSVYRYHWGFEDPPKAAKPGESELDAFRRIRDQIKLTMEAFVGGYRQGMETGNSR